MCFHFYSLLCFWISFSRFCSSFSLCADQMVSRPCSIPCFVRDPNRMTQSSSTHLTCESLFTAERFSVEVGREAVTWSSNTGNWVTTSRKWGLLPGSTWKHPCLFFFWATKPLTFLRDQRARMDWQMSQEFFFAPEEIHSFIHSFVHFQSLISGVGA